MTTEPAPLAVWDASAALMWCSSAEQLLERTAWAREHIPDVNRVYRVDFYLIDAPFAVLYRYRENTDGHIYYDPATDGPAKDEPVTVILGELPPAHLLGAA